MAPEQELTPDLITVRPSLNRGAGTPAATLRDCAVPTLHVSEVIRLKEKPCAVWLRVAPLLDPLLLFASALVETALPGPLVVLTRHEVVIRDVDVDF